MKHFSKFTSIEERLFTKRFINPATECWEWTGHCNSGGYGVICLNGRQRIVSRISANMFLKFDTQSPLLVLHRCDNPPCFNPKHLFIGTQFENLKDMTCKGHRATWKRFRQTKLNPKKIKEIRQMLNDNISMKKIGLRFNICATHVWRIKHKKRWV